MRRKDVFLLVFLAALWGGSYLFMRIAAPILGSIFTMALRVTIATAALAVYARFFGSFPDFRRTWKHYLVLGFFNCALPYVLIANAVTGLNASIAAIINSTTPLFTAVVASVWMKERLSSRRALGVVLGIFGVGILMGWNPLPRSRTTWLSSAQALLAAFCYGIAAVYGRLRVSETDPLHASIGPMASSAVFLLPLAVPFVPAGIPPALPLAAVAALAVFCTSGAYLIFFRLIRNVGAVQTSTVTFLVPFFSMLWAVLFLGESVSLGMFAGLGVILFSVWLVLGGARKREPQRMPS